jgi:hypothetical protein|tara:strand:- start:1487 stop:1873 length:387 start_codon:yes stop_codon:yes gene_type:complete
MEIELQHGKKLTYVSETGIKHQPADENLDPLEQLESLEYRLDMMGFKCIMPRKGKSDVQEYIRAINEAGRTVTVETYLGRKDESGADARTVRYNIKGLKEDVGFVNHYLQLDALVMTCGCRRLVQKTY